MNLELLNTIATFTTTAVIAATAVAALAQLRHLRASNQIEALLAVNKVFNDNAFQDARLSVRQHLSRLMKDPDFRRFACDYIGRAQFDGDIPLEFMEVRRAASTVGGNLENMGNMIRNGLLDRDAFLEQWTPMVTNSWEYLEPLLRMMREDASSDAPWEDFEYLTVLSREWEATRGSCYPHGVRRILPSFARAKASAAEQDRADA